MKNTVFSISFALLLIVSIIKYPSDALTFLEGKYFFWLVILCSIAIGVALKNNSKTLKINRFDAILLLVVALGTGHFIFVSKATIYSYEIWNYIGYLLLYFLARNCISTADLTKKGVQILLYFCSSTAVLNVFLMYFQSKRWIASPNEFFVTTGLFFSPNHLGIYLSVGLLCIFFLWQKVAHSWLKIGLGLGGLLIFSGLCISESRGAFISLFVALGYYFCSSFQLFRRGKGKIKTKSLLKWKVFIGIAVILASSFYFLSTVNKSKSESTSGRWFATQQILEQIINTPFGHGIGSFSKEYNKAKAVYFENNTNWDEMKNAGYIYNANNDLLQLTFELGVVWMAIFIVFIVLLFWKKQDNPEIRFCRSLLVCLLLFSLTSSIVVLPVLIIIACSCAVVIINTSQSKVIYEFKNRTIYNWIGIGLILSFLFVICNRLQAETKLYKLYQGKMYLKGTSQLQHSILKMDNQGEEYFMGGITLLKNGYFDDGMSYLQIGFERSGRPSLGRTLASILQKQKRYAQAEEIYTYNKNVEPYRYEARMDLLTLFIETKQKEKATLIAQEIINLPVKIPSQTIDGYKRKAKSYLDGVEGE